MNWKKRYETPSLTIGSLVTIRRDLSEGMHLKHGVAEAMAVLAGRQAKITYSNIKGNYISIDIDSGGFSWCKEMFDGF